jgi:hypothetical protein
MDLQKRAQETALSGLVDNMLPSAIFNRFDLSDSNGLDLTLSATKTTSPLALMSVLNFLSCHGTLMNALERT